MSTLVWVIPGGGKSTFVENYTGDNHYIDWDAWQRYYRTKHPNLQKKIGFRRFLEACLKSCRKHNPNSTILTSKLLHLHIADEIWLRSDVEVFIQTTTRPGREVWGREKCTERLKDYNSIVEEYSLQDKVHFFNGFYNP